MSKQMEGMLVVSAIKKWSWNLMTRCLMINLNEKPMYVGAGAVLVTSVITALIWSLLLVTASKSFSIFS